MKKISLAFLLFFFCSSPALASLSCAPVLDLSVALGKGCGTLGETRMLPDGSSIVACVISDTSGTGEVKNCNWTSMTKEGGSEGSMCGHFSMFSRAGQGSYKTCTDCDPYYFCSYTTPVAGVGAIQCEGKDVIGDSYTAKTTTTPNPGYTYVGSYPLTYGVMYSLFASDHCPSGYTMKSWMPIKPNTSKSTNAGLIICDSLVYEFTCVKD